MMANDKVKAVKSRRTSSSSFSSPRSKKKKGKQGRKGLLSSRRRSSTSDSRKRALHTPWTAEEDSIVRNYMKQYPKNTSQQVDWATIAEKLSGRTTSQVQQRWNKVLSPTVKRGQWAPGEDALLLELIKSPQFKNNWVEIAKRVPGRNSKQCRERWFNNLHPSVNHGPWTPEEDEKLLRLQKEHGGSWSKITPYIVGRTVNSVKTRFHTLNRERLHNRPWLPGEDQIIIDSRLELGKRWSAIAKQLKDRAGGVVRHRWAHLLEAKPELAQLVHKADSTRSKNNRPRTKSLKKRPLSSSAPPGKDPKRTSLQRNNASSKSKGTKKVGRRRSSLEIVQAASLASAARRDAKKAIPELFVPDWVEPRDELLPDRPKGLYQQTQSVNVLADFIAGDNNDGAMALEQGPAHQGAEKDLIHLMKKLSSSGDDGNDKHFGKRRNSSTRRSGTGIQRRSSLDMALDGIFADGLLDIPLNESKMSERSKKLIAHYSSSRKQGGPAPIASDATKKMRKRDRIKNFFRKKKSSSAVRRASGASAASRRSSGTGPAGQAQGPLIGSFDTLFGNGDMFDIDENNNIEDGGADLMDIWDAVGDSLRDLNLAQQRSQRQQQAS